MGKGKEEKGLHEANGYNDLNEFDTILNRIRLRLDISDIADKYKNVIYDNISKKIERERRKKLYIRRIGVAVSGIAAILVLGFFLFGSVENKLDKQLLTVIERIDIQGKEVSIVSGEKQEIVEDKKITQTKEGNIVVGNQQKIEAQDIKTEYVTVVVPKGKRTTVQLSDGSVAWVNSGSKLTFPKNFEKNIRKIYLDGEIYIEVTKDEKRPFVVCTDAVEINVLGTRFNVNAYRNEKTCSVVLVEGSVETRNNKKKNILKPGQGYFNTDGEIMVKPVDTYSYICWKDGRLKLMDEPFDVLLKRLSRYYDVEIHSDEELNNLRFEGNLALRDSIEEILQTLSISKEFVYAQNNNIIHIKKK